MLSRLGKNISAKEFGNFIEQLRKMVKQEEELHQLNLQTKFEVNIFLVQHH